MTKSNLIDAVVAKTGMKKKDADAAVAAMIASMEEALVAGERVQIVGFGTFEVKERAARKGVNPFTGKDIEIAASKHVSFSAGKTLKDKVNK